MKKILLAALLLPLSVFAQTYPSPTFNNMTVNGTATFASSPTFTGGIAISNLSNIAANTVLANVTSSTAGVTAFAMPSCSATGNALQYTSGTGFTCVTGYAPLASPTFTGTVTIPAGASISGYLTTASASSTYAPLASPTLTGTPTAPTATNGTNTTQIATTAYVTASAGGATSVSVAGGSNVTLTAAQAGTPSITLTGALTANINVIVPSSPDKWTITNSTTGAFTVTVKTSAGTGVAVAQGFSSNLWSDGTNVYQQMTDYITWFNSLPTSLPASAGVLWNNGGILSKS